ncbi:hypothetical protein J5N97_016096 [Dioscorea zingiberensis]|uniref:Sodium/calcium exchanger membrane region domain-containing protein n=1 Tax=Dioscorea zingiberensis TaxID=325984 RepID=A0A9D5HEV0_9LILI|nr:hypothetical protein J5N97_016096 [Dioscorea zingiberensis]
MQAIARRSLLLTRDHRSSGHRTPTTLKMAMNKCSTASQYFCSSVESLSRELRLSPTIAGVTLLSLGNGSPDVFASIVSFRAGAGEVGLSSVLGGAFFVSCVVVGIINICASGLQSNIRIDRSSFIRDVCFFIAVLSSLLAILIAGKITIWGAMAFTSLYFIYVSIISATHLCRDKYEELVVPILDTKELDEPVSIAKEALESTEQQETSTSNCFELNDRAISSYIIWFLYLIDMPLYLPRRLTIPDITEERWSRPFAVASASIAPLLVATLWNTKRGAEELVGLLVSLGYVFGISPAILGLTVLAWGNSIGDLIANVAMAMNGGQDGAQIAISGCYAGPIFNTLAGLGMSLVVSAWSVHPAPFVIPVGPALFEILGFMIGGLLWALVILPRKEMKLDRVLGIGLLAIYLCFLSLRLSQSLGLVQV